MQFIQLFYFVYINILLWSLKLPYASAVLTGLLGYEVLPKSLSYSTVQNFCRAQYMVWFCNTKLNVNYFTLVHINKRLAIFRPYEHFLQIRSW